MDMTRQSASQDKIKPMNLGFPGCGSDPKQAAFEMPTAESTLFGLLFLGATGTAELAMPSIVEQKEEGVSPPDNSIALPYWRCRVQTPLGSFSCLHRGVAQNKNGQSRPPSIIELIDLLTCQAGMIEILKSDIFSGGSDRTAESLRLDILQASRAEESLVAALGPFRKANFTSRSTVLVAEEACSDRPELEMPGADKPFGLLELAAAEASDDIFFRILGAAVKAGPLEDGRLSRMARTLAALGLGADGLERVAAIEAAELGRCAAPAVGKRRSSL